MWSGTFRNLASLLITLVAWEPCHAVSAWGPSFRGRLVTTGAPGGSEEHADAAPYRSPQAQAKKTVSVKRVTRDCTTSTGQPCQFPFTYHGITYTGCTDVDQGTMWCSTQTDAHGMHIHGHWGGCSKDCRVHQHKAANDTESATSDAGSATSPGEEASGSARHDLGRPTLHKAAPTRDGSNWMTAQCGAGEKVLGGGCYATLSDKYDFRTYQHSAPEKKEGWTCGGYGTEKTVYAICSSEVVISIKKEKAKGAATASCDSDEKVVSGGCVAPSSSPGRSSSPSGDGAWSCEGSKPEGMFEAWAVCTKTIEPVIKESSVGGDMVTLKCDEGAYVIGGGCNATTSPYIFDFNAPTPELDGWSCGGRGSKKKVWALCIDAGTTTTTTIMTTSTVSTVILTTTVLSVTTPAPVVTTTASGVSASTAGTSATTASSRAPETTTTTLAAPETTATTEAPTTTAAATTSSTTVSSTPVTTVSSVSSTSTGTLDRAEPSSGADGDPESQFRNVRGSEFDVWLPGCYGLLTLTDVLYPAGTPLLHVNGSLVTLSACSKPMLLTDVRLAGTRLHGDDIHLYAGSSGRIGLGAHGLEDMTEAEFLNSINTAKKTMVEFSVPPGKDTSSRVLERRARIAIGDVSMRVDWYRNSGSGARYMDFSAWLTGEPREKVSGLLGYEYKYQEVIDQVPATCEDDLSESAEPGSYLFAALGEMGK